MIGITLMSNDCTCLYGGYDDYDESGFQHRETRHARKLHTCGECRRPIAPGEPYCYFSSKHDGRIFNTRTCLICEEIREALYCDGYYFGRLWQDIADQMFAHGGLTIECVNKLVTMEAKQYLQQRWMEWVSSKI